MTDKNPLQEEIEKQTAKQRNQIQQEEKKDQASAHIGRFFSFLLFLSVVLGLIATLVRLFF